MDIKDLTTTGRLLLVATVLGALGIGLPLLAWASTALPSTSRVPKIVFMLPVIVIGAVIFYGGGFVLTALGKPVRHDRLPRDAAEDEA